MKILGVCLLLALVISATCHGADFDEDPLARYRTRGERHGLYEIREAARRFIERENGAKKSGWRVGDPDIRVVVWECAVPLKARWRSGEPGARPAVTVLCPRTLKAAPVKDWKVTVPVAPLE